MSATTAVAIAGLAATTLTAICALGVSVWLQTRTERRHVREIRYNALLTVYADAGRVLSNSSALALRALDARARNDEAELAATAEDIQGNELIRETRHAVNMLRLHDAAPEVLEALDAWRAWVIWTQDPGEVGDLDELRAEVARLTESYYRRAGRHARAQLGVATRRTRPREATA